MKTHYGVNPSFCSWALGRLPLFGEPLRRAKRFEIFTPQGQPTGEEGELGADGWPLQDGGWHGVRLFGDMGGTMPQLTLAGVSAIDGAPTVKLHQNPGESASLCWIKGGPPPAKVWLDPRVGKWHRPSLEALAYTRPVTLRTLDYGYQARKAKRPDWSKPRVLPSDPLQGEEMAVELQCELANALQCSLWWNAPPRFELGLDEYERRLEVYLAVIKDAARRPPILEYGNELWNDGFPVHQWLTQNLGGGETWQKAAAAEVTILKRVADRVFGEHGPMGQRSYYLFVGGHVGTPDTLSKILGALPFAPDIAGPAFYVTPLKADRDRWHETGDVPTETQLMDSMFANLPALEAKLRLHAAVAIAAAVPFLGVYECGQSLIARGRPWKQTAIKVQSSERMGDLYREIRLVLERSGVNLANWYSAASDQSPGDASVDAFGLLESCDLTRVLPKAIAARGE